MKQTWASISEAARYFGVSPGRIKKGIDEGHLKKGVHYGEFPWMRGIRINLKAVERFLISETERLGDIDDLVEKLIS